MAIFLLACKEMATRIMKKLLIWMVPLHFESCRMVLPMFNGNIMVSNNILTLFCRIIRFLFYNSLYRGMHIKATIVAYAFSVQCFEYATILAYAG